MRLFSYLLLASLAALLLCSCSTRTERHPVRTDVRLVVAPFLQPRSDGDLLAGYIPEDHELASGEDLQALEDELMELVAASERENVRGPKLVTACVPPRRTEPPLTHWAGVGRCAEADYLLLPVLLDFRERIGGEAGAERPAEVVLDLFVIDVAETRLVSRFHFDEAQVSLSENFLALETFFARGGTWISARELAREGMALGVKDLGL